MASATLRKAELVEVDPAHPRLAHPSGPRQLFQCLVRWHLPHTSQTGAWALEIKIRNSPGLPVGWAKCSSAISCFLSSRLHSTTGMPRGSGKSSQTAAKPAAHEEVTSIARLAGPRSIVLVGPEATEEKLKSEPLGDFEVLHFAVHGMSNVAEPERSALVLRTNPQSKEDGLWQAREIRRESLKAELVSLGVRHGSAKAGGRGGSG